MGKETSKHKEREKLIIIDGNALVHRAFHALPDTLRLKDGQLTNAVYGFLLVFLNVLDQFKPKYVAAAFDKKGKTFRHEAFEGYKAKRVQAPEELYKQIPLVKKVLEAFGVPVYSKKGFEADDIVGSIAKNIEDNSNLESIIVTGDLDTLQLVDDNTKVFTLRKGTKDTVLYDEKGVEERMGVKPDQVVDFKALAGDSSDNIPGVSGVGGKTAVDLLKEFGSLENVYKNLDKVKEAVRKKLDKDKDKAFLSQKLAEIQAQEDFSFDLKKAEFGDYDRENLAKTLKSLEFNTLIKRLGLEETAEGEEAEEPGQKKSQGKYKALQLVDFEKLRAVFENKKNIRGKILVAGWEVPQDNLRAGGVFAARLDYVACLFEGTKEILAFGADKENWKQFLQLLGRAVTAGGQLVFFSKKEELEVFWLKLTEAERLEVVDLLDTPGDDLSLLTYLVKGGREEVTVKQLARDLGEETDLLEGMKAASKKQAKLFEQEEEEEDRKKALDFLAWKLQLMAKGFRENEEKMTRIVQEQQKRGVTPKPVGGEILGKQKTNMRFVYDELEKPLIAALSRMELAGVKLDSNKLKALGQEYTREADKIRKQVFKLAGEEFNLDSSKQLSEVFYEKLGYAPDGIKKGKSGYYSTSAEALDILAEKYEVASLVKRYRELIKLVNTYIEPLPKLVEPRTGRLHTNFNQTVAATGRLSSSNPNLQNIPIRTTEGYRIREGFVADAGFELVSADYSQIELRVAAHYSGDETMLKVFQENGDIHRETAARIRGVKPETITKEERRTAKELNFGLLYGMSAFGFSRSAGISREEAGFFIKKYKDEFPAMFEYLEEAKETAKEKGYVETILGRRRYVEEMRSGNWQSRASGERMAVNMPLQGTAADIMKLAILKADEYIREKKLTKEARILLSVHDEILFEIKKEKVKKLSRELKKIMEGVVTLKVPLLVEVKRGRNWKTMEEM